MRSDCLDTSRRYVREGPHAVGPKGGPPRLTLAIGLWWRFWVGMAYIIVAILVAMYAASRFDVPLIAWFLAGMLANMVGRKFVSGTGDR